MKTIRKKMRNLSINKLIERLKKEVKNLSNLETDGIIIDLEKAIKIKVGMAKYNKALITMEVDAERYNPIILLTAKEIKERIEEEILKEMEEK
jgi:hypothetical protein